MQAMAAVLSHQGAETQRGTKACAVTEIFVFLRVLVPWWHLLSFPVSSLPVLSPLKFLIELILLSLPVSSLPTAL
jgi:hypothetical protein